MLWLGNGSQRITALPLGQDPRAGRKDAFAGQDFSEAFCKHRMSLAWTAVPSGVPTLHVTTGQPLISITNSTLLAH